MAESDFDGVFDEGDELIIFVEIVGEETEESAELVHPKGIIILRKIGLNLLNQGSIPVPKPQFLQELQVLKKDLILLHKLKLRLHILLQKHAQLTFLIRLQHPIRMEHLIERKKICVTVMHALHGFLLDNLVDFLLVMVGLKCLEGLENRVQFRSRETS